MPGLLISRKRTRSEASGKSIGEIKCMAENRVQALKPPLGELVPKGELGAGTPHEPYNLPLRGNPNKSGCHHCLADQCHCVFFERLLDATFRRLDIKRITEVSGSRHLCAKSLLPTFVSRMVRLMEITSEDTFYDLGCGNGSILFQVAFLTGARCVGIEISEHNAKVAKKAWEVIRPELEGSSGRSMPEVNIITSDMTKILADERLFESERGKTVILLSNLLFPKSLTHYLSERFRRVPSGTRILCFDDLYPHSRSVAAIRDPEAFRLFAMTDYRWQECSVEWCTRDGPFFIHRRR
ncbi:hypothetical protein, conserved [Trypanosoma brucei gambiense DAL972]|uniref:Histone-lysine N-methyltransferase, H3 lysine-79 specific n=1 Tax=Trypanosoma brucei gambiense (strain MHOM/CI/86/DAL972) TaxID=679716 RepID=C9ZUW8_TRYB9|nr:hypothetical protein, conserved [Trypanosoma brucei gambiense DAL972]CBH13206.1 hypothetical protein, conserved [Trypanosoma brucei gambiense DAL972]|eukprot:XP_011775483.1 hypothetical protein, conserved [Trypanosoma brucei gambiense DAL972]